MDELHEIRRLRESLEGARVDLRTEWHNVDNLLRECERLEGLLRNAETQRDDWIDRWTQEEALCLTWKNRALLAERRLAKDRLIDVGSA